ncbi:MAG: hypothetical protein AABZ31_14895, partial [Bdellovibrionota bacterium]
GQVTVGENSIVVFRRIENANIPDLGYGNFKFEVNGNVKVAIAGEVTELSGANSQLQVVIGKNKKARFKLLTGQMTVKGSDGKKNILKANTVAVLSQKEHATVNFKDIKFSMTPKIVDHYWKLYDIYETKNSLELSRRPEPETALKSYRIGWSNRDINTIAKVQLSKTEDFNINETFNTNESGFTFERLNLGTNFWRVSLDNGKNWSQAQSIKVQTAYMKDAAPKIQPYSENIPLLGPTISFNLDVRSPPETIGYVAEASYSPDFPQEDTRTFFKSGSSIKLSFYKIGSYYYRFRTVLRDQSLSEWSATQKFNIYKPERPTAPVLAQINAKTLYVGDAIKANWNTTGVVTEILVVDAKNKVIHKAKGRSLEWAASKPGAYKIVARSYNEFGQSSPDSKPVMTRVLKDPSLNIAKVKRQKRAVAAEQESEAVSSIDLEGLRPLNTNNSGYNKSQFSVHGLLWTLQSSEQISTDADRAIAGGLGLRGLYWLGRTGFEGLLKSQVFDATTSSQSAINSLEARMHYRFTTSLPISFLPQMQVSAFGGIEAYRNSGALFTSQYELVKFGTSLAFPLGSEWSTGGEFVYGVSTDSSSKAEISGFISRFFSKKWSFGVGYRLTFFEAGSEDSTPTKLLPYREGYTEGYSALYYHF